MATKSEESLLVHCEQCEAIVDAAAIGDYSIYQEPMDAPGRYVFLKCKKCYSPILVFQEINWTDDGPEEWDSPTIIYPNNERNLGLSVPETIRRAYSEAAACFRAKAFTACAVMCRKVLEGVCSAHNAEGKNLSKKLDWLNEKGLIDDRLSEWATALRMLGNEAAHDVEVTFDRRDAEDALDFSEALNEYLFTFRDRFEAFKKRRAEKNEKKKLVET
ncbi:DUF4145 domain-containing protein [Candidatus Uhrbacteria bacterium]|nr:DUF4145 domain-containing protein [Candidatus Uhrbacteria bacterium]